MLIFVLKVLMHITTEHLLKLSECTR